MAAAVGVAATTTTVGTLGGVGRRKSQTITATAATHPRPRTKARTLRPVRFGSGAASARQPPGRAAAGGGAAVFPRQFGCGLSGIANSSAGRVWRSYLVETQAANAARCDPAERALK